MRPFVVVSPFAHFAPFVAHGWDSAQAAQLGAHVLTGDAGARALRCAVGDGDMLFQPVRLHGEFDARPTLPRLYCGALPLGLTVRPVVYTPTDGEPQELHLELRRSGAPCCTLACVFVQGSHGQALAEAIEEACAQLCAWYAYGTNAQRVAVVAAACALHDLHLPPTPGHPDAVELIRGRVA